MKQPKTQKERKKAYVKRMKIIRALFWCGFVCVFLVSAVTLYAKYYGKESRKGVATASGLYFTSNYLEPITDVSKPEEFPERINSSHWEGIGTCTIDIGIYNYSNILLYNDENLNITYDMHLKLMDEESTEAVSDDVETYAVTYKTIDENGNAVDTTVQLTKNEVVTISGLYLPGGQARSNQVVLSITPNQDGSKVAGTYRSKQIAVWVEPTAPDYIIDSCKMGARISASPSKQAFNFSDAFDIMAQMEELETLEAKKALADSYSAFGYKVQTSGEVTDDYANTKLKVTWNSNYLEMDMYNKYYEEAITNGSYTVAADGWASITMDLVSYTSMEFNFFKTQKYSELSWNSIDDFKNLVQVSLETTGTTD